MDLKFGHFRIRDETRLLFDSARPVDLSSRSFDILSLLLSKPNQVVAKSELFETVWPNLLVEENTLQVHISALRKVLGAGMITTIHGRGYKYSGPPPVPASADQGLGKTSDQPDAEHLHPLLDLSGGRKVPVTGGCLCGMIRYVVTEAALDTNFCHCRMCQRFSGAPVTAGSTYRAGAVRFTNGEPKYYRSSPFAERGFCENCGSSLTYRPVDPPVTPNWADWILIYTTTLDNPDPNAPTWHLGVESQVPWLTISEADIRVQCQESPDIVEAWAAFNLPVP